MLSPAVSSVEKRRLCGFSMSRWSVGWEQREGGDKIGSWIRSGRRDEVQLVEQLGGWLVGPSQEEVERVGFALGKREWPGATPSGRTKERSRWPVWGKAGRRQLRPRREEYAKWAALAGRAERE